MYTKKHYKAIAKIIKDNTQITGSIMAYVSRQTVCEDLADYFVKDNSRFDREKFLEACGL